MLLSNNFCVDYPLYQHKRLFVLCLTPRHVHTYAPQKVKINYVKTNGAFIMFFKCFLWSFFLRRQQEQSCIVISCNRLPYISLNVNSDNFVVHQVNILLMIFFICQCIYTYCGNVFIVKSKTKKAK